MFSKIRESTRDKKEQLINQQRMRIREKAISNARASIALAGKRVEDYDQDQLEIIVKNEEEKIVQNFRKSALYGVLVLLGIGYF